MFVHGDKKGSIDSHGDMCIRTLERKVKYAHLQKLGYEERIHCYANRCIT